VRYFGVERFEGNIAGDYHDRDAAFCDRDADGARENLRQQFGAGDEFDVVAAFLKRMFGMCRLKIVDADFMRWDMSCDGEYGYAAALRVEQPVIRCRFPGPQLPAQTASLPVTCASPAAANAAPSSCRT